MPKNLKDLVVFSELPLWFAWLTVAAFIGLHLTQSWLADFSHPARFLLLFIWLFIIVLWNSFKVSHHVEKLSESLREPMSTLLLTLTATSIEIVTIATIMKTGNANPTLARDTMYSIIMIILNGIVGLSLFLGGIRYNEQRYNLRGSVEFLSVILVLAVIALVLPNFTLSTSTPTFSTPQALFLIFASLSIYAIFLGIQTISHRTHFISPHEPKTPNQHTKKRLYYHMILLIAYLIPTLLIAKQIAIPMNYLISADSYPELGGLFVAILVLTPEGVSAIRASLSNHLQRSVNIALGATLATTALTIPAVLIMGIWTHHTVILGLENGNLTLLVLSLITALVTFANGRSGLLQGALHLLLFCAYILMIFD